MSLDEMESYRMGTCRSDATGGTGGTGGRGTYLSSDKRVVSVSLFLLITTFDSLTTGASPLLPLNLFNSLVVTNKLLPKVVTPEM